jgi:hypothetical protein
VNKRKTRGRSISAEDRRTDLLDKVPDEGSFMFSVVVPLGLSRLHVESEAHTR